MKKFKVTITERIYASYEVEVEAADQDEAIEKGRSITSDIPINDWQTDTEVVGEEAEEVV
jgi:hypothetical protein